MPAGAVGVGGYVLADQSLVDPADPYAHLGRWDLDERLRGMAWSDGHTVRVAWAQLPPNPSGIYNADKLTTVRTIVVG